ncbi:hypothetical protein B0H67DRAFT_450297, partial [Lasiosphaeris hirsuta]
LLLTASSKPVPVTQQFVGQGRILVLGGSTFFNATPADRIGCLNKSGIVTVDDCAVFTRQDKMPHPLTTSAGSCSFRDSRMPANSESAYGKKSYAFSCREDNPPPSDSDEGYYTVDGFNYPFLCNGNLFCYYDIKKFPARENDAAPIWQYFWGSSEQDIIPGHMQVLWLWAPVKG